VPTVVDERKRTPENGISGSGSESASTEGYDLAGALKIGASAFSLKVAVTVVLSKARGLGTTVALVWEFDSFTTKSNCD
jgi:hypothetical protein